MIADRRRRVAVFAAAVTVASAAVVVSGGEDDPGDPGPRPRTSPERARGGAGPIGRDDVLRHFRALQAIADRSDGNRAAGTAGDRATVAYLERTLRAAGWRVTTQPVAIPFFRERRPGRLADLRRAQFAVAQYSPSADVRARVRRARGLGCSPGDFGGIRRGEIALVRRGTCRFAAKGRNAARRGAAALIVDDPGEDTPVAATLGRPGVPIPVVTVGEQAVRGLEGRTIVLRVETTSDLRRTRNVIAETEGASRLVMAGAHHDSVRAGPGINDDGSGVAALLAVAERLRDRPGLRLGFWAGEEAGLYGSRAYVRRLSAAERRAVRVYLNFDMVGSPNGRVLVYDRDDAFERLLRRSAGGVQGETRLQASSDHASFAAAGIPVGGLFTGADERGRGGRPSDPCYHRACDTVRNVDAGSTARAARAIERALRSLTR